MGRVTIHAGAVAGEARGLCGARGGPGIYQTISDPAGVQAIDCLACLRLLAVEGQRKVSEARPLAAQVVDQYERLRERSEHFYLVVGDAVAQLEGAADEFAGDALDDLLDELRPWLTHRCRYCGCTEALACDGGCGWAAKDRCSRCE